MTYGSGPVPSQTNYLPPEFQLPSENPKESQELLAKRERLTASILNVKTNGQFEKQELQTGEQWFSNQTSGGAIGSGVNRDQRYGFRQVFDLVELNGGPIPASGVFISLPHSLPVSNITAILRIFGGGIVSSGVPNVPNFVSLPNAAVSPNDNIDLYFDSKNINIKVGTSWGPLSQVYVVIEYLKQP